MTELPQQGLSEKIKILGSHGAAYAAGGSFLLYVLGYLALRFHLTALGVGTDLAVLDERYLFAGAKFIAYLCVMVPSLVLLVLLLGGILYGAYRVLPAGIAGWLGKAVTWVAQPTRLLLGGIVFSVFMIQFVMRNCFELNNLLLRSDFLGVAIPGAWLLRENEGRITLYFLGLVAGCAISGLILLMLRRQPPTGDFLVFAHYLLFFLAAVQVLLLPVNYGYLVQDKSLPRVASLDGLTPLGPAMEAWLVWEGREGMTYLVRNRQSNPVWEGREGMTYLVRNRQSNPATKTLVTLPRDQVKRIEITAYDRIFPTLFAPQAKTTL